MYILDLAAAEKLCRLNKLCKTFAVLTGLELLITLLIKNLNTSLINTLVNLLKVEILLQCCYSKKRFFFFVVVVYLISSQIIFSLRFITTNF